MTDKLPQIQNMIYEIRGHKVMLDSDLAALYGVELRALNQAVKRNIGRFPSDFMFQLTQDEWNNLRSQIVISSYNHGGRRYLPYAFTEQGVSVLSSVLNSERAINVNIQIMRAFVKLRHYILSQSGANEQIVELRQLLMLHIDNAKNYSISNDYKLSEHDKAIEKIILALNSLIEKPKKTRKIGFHVND